MLIVLILLGGFAAQQTQSQSQPPLTLAQILLGLQSKSSGMTLEEKNEFITKRVLELGVTFDLIPEFESELKNAGASGSLIEAIRQKSSKPISTPKPTPIQIPEPTPEQTPKPEQTPTPEIKNVSNPEPIMIAAAKPPAETIIKMDNSVYLKRGDELFDAGNYDQAINEYNEVVRLNPKNADIYIKLGLSHYYLGHSDLASENYLEAIKIKPSLASEIYLKCLFDTSQVPIMIENCNQAAKAYPGFGLIYYKRGTFYFSKGDYGRAIQDFTQAVRINPMFISAYIFRGFSYYRADNLDNSILDYTKVIELDPDNAGAYNNRGISYEKKGDISRAIADFTKVIELNPQNAFAYANRGDLYLKVKAFPQAIADYRKALEIDPNYEKAKTSLNKLLKNQ
ncbi:MAG TPA: tetratricopeptide repeat protein [Pyrinomonadaceae bacterium]|nr:tetratricopeptide repeat protein [Pyrinomonadaceae bacterium]